MEVEEGYHAFTMVDDGFADELTGAYYADLTPPEIQTDLTAQQASWLPDYLEGILPTGGELDFVITLQDNQPYGMTGAVNNTVLWSGQQSRWTTSFSLTAQEGEVLRIACLDALGNYTEQAYLITSRDWQRGDINGDGQADAADALMILQHSVQLLQLNAAEQAAADTDSSMSVDALDALYVLQYSVGILSSLYF